MLTGEYRQSVIANNLANAETVGFKRDIASFMERDPARLAGERVGPSNELYDAMTGGVWMARTVTDHSEGTPMQTNVETDVALNGPGFLMVGDGGKALLTRDGRMIVDPFGNLVAATDGKPILGDGGFPIRVNPRGERLSINEDGWISQDGTVVARLALVDVADKDRMLKEGATRFSTDPQNYQPALARVMQGHLELSSVEAVKEMVSMIEASRAYQLNAQMVTLQDQTAGRLLSIVANV
jgi:flagellar basal body rod protein FlgG